MPQSHKCFYDRFLFSSFGIMSNCYFLYFDRILFFQSNFWMSHKHCLRGKQIQMHTLFLYRTLDGGNPQVSAWIGFWFYDIPAELFNFSNLVYSWISSSQYNRAIIRENRHYHSSIDLVDRTSNTTKQIYSSSYFFVNCIKMWLKIQRGIQCYTKLFVVCCAIYADSINFDVEYYYVQ